MRNVQLTPPAVSPKDKWTPPDYAEAKEAQKLVTIAGPLANYMAHQQGAPLSSKADSQAESQVGTLADAPAPTVAASDHVGGSVTGSNMQIVQRTFRVQSTVQVTFEVPAHAATPRLRGTYESFVKQAGNQDGGDADIEFLVLNEEQFADFMNKRTGEVTFAADDAHAQEVNTSLPPTMDQPVRYHLIFQNNSRGTEKKFVSADFRMEF